MGILEFLSGPFTTILNKLVPDADQRLQLQQKAMEMAQAGEFHELDLQAQQNTQQADIDKTTAAQPGMHFRDGAGWVCVAGFALMQFKAPIEWVCALAGHPVVLPAVDTTVTNDMLMGLLGLGGMHVYQQVKTA